MKNGDGDGRRKYGMEQHEQPPSGRRQLYFGHPPTTTPSIYSLLFALSTSSIVLFINTHSNIIHTPTPQYSGHFSGLINHCEPNTFRLSPSSTWDPPTAPHAILPSLSTRMSQSSSFEPVGIAPGFATVPPTASRPPGLGESSLNGAPQWETDDGPKGRRKSSVPYPPPVRPPNHRNSSSGMSVIHTSPNPMHGEDEIEPEERKKARSSSSGSTPVLTSKFGSLSGEEAPALIQKVARHAGRAST